LAIDNIRIDLRRADELVAEIRRRPSFEVRFPAQAIVVPSGSSTPRHEATPVGGKPVAGNSDTTAGSGGPLPSVEMSPTPEENKVQPLTPTNVARLATGAAQLT